MASQEDVVKAVALLIDNYLSEKLASVGTKSEETQGSREAIDSLEKLMERRLEENKENYRLDKARLREQYEEGDQFISYIQALIAPCLRGVEESGSSYPSPSPSPALSGQKGGPLDQLKKTLSKATNISSNPKDSSSKTDNRAAKLLAQVDDKARKSPSLTNGVSYPVLKPPATASDGRSTGLPDANIVYREKNSSSILEEPSSQVNHQEEAVPKKKVTRPSKRKASILSDDEPMERPGARRSTRASRTPEPNYKV